MLNVFFGNDTVKVRQKAFDYVDKEKGDATLVLVDADSYEAGVLGVATEGVSLFGDKYLYVLDNWSADSLAYEELIKNLDRLKESEHRFVVVEGTMLAPEKKKFEKHADKFEEHKSDTAKSFNSFSLADAFAKRDRKLLWLLWNEALLAGNSPEELAGILWWQIKTLRIAQVGNSAEEVGLKDFPFSKAKRALGNFKKGELEKLSRDLLTLVHDSRLGKFELPLALERWILKI